MRIRRIVVRDLFGTFNHTIPLNLDDRITIIHGPNGFGKTVLLKMIVGVFNRRYAELRGIPFSELMMQFDEGTELRVTKAPDSRQLPLQPARSHETSASTLVFQYQKPSSDPQTYSPTRAPLAQEARIPPDIIEDFVPGLNRVSRNLWTYLPTNELLSLTDILDRFPDRLPTPAGRAEPEPDWLETLRASIPVRFIETQRLLTLTGRRPGDYERGALLQSVVDIYAEELAKAIQSKLAESAALSQSLDRTFPARLVQHPGHSHLSDEDLRQKLSELENKRSRVMAAGLLDKEEDMAFQPSAEPIDEQTRNVLSVYVEDVEAKLRTFDDLVNRLELLQNIINSRFLYKTMSVNKEKGFAFTTSKGDNLSLTSLSSGEQHELVLLYEFLFKLQPGSLVLIDEPELSLHVAWQKKFLRDLQDITSLVSCDVIVATHSPQIINDRWDLTVELQGPNE